MAANVNIVVNAQDRASGVFRKISNSLTGILRVALGIQLSQVLNRMGTAVRNFAVESVDAAAGLQMFRIGIETLIAREQLMKNETMEIGEAFAFAAAMSGDYIKKLQDIALLSPFQFADVQRVVRQAMAFGFGAEEALSYAEATLNVAAGVGATNDMLRRMAYNLAQIRLQGKVTKLDIRQLALAGFDLGAVLQYVGKMMEVEIDTHLDFNRAIESGTITWADFTRGYAEYADTYFGGASERMARTFFGLKNTFKDVFGVTMPQILGPTLDAITTYTSELLNMLIRLRESGDLERWGEQIKVAFDEKIKPVFDFLLYGKTDRDNPVVRLLNMFRHLKEEGFFGETWSYIFKQITGIDLTPLQNALKMVRDIIISIETSGLFADPTLSLFDALFKLDEGTIAGIRDTINGIMTEIGIIISEGPMSVAGGMSLAALLGISPEAILDLQTEVGKIVTWFEEQGEILAPVFERMGESLQNFTVPALLDFADAILEVKWEEIEFFVETLEKMVQWLGENDEALAELTKMAAQTLAILSILWRGLWNIVGPILGFLRDTILDLGTVMLNLLTGDIDQAIFVLGRILARAVVFIVSFVVQVFAGLLDAILGVVLGDQWQGWDAFFEMIRNVINLWRIVLNDYILAGITTTLSNAWAAIVLYFTDWGPKMEAEATALIIQWITGAQTGWTTFIEETLPGWMTALKASWEDSYIKQFVDMGIDALKGFVQGFADHLETAKKDLAATWGKIVAWIRSLLGEHSPSKVFMDMGANALKGFLIGLQPKNMISLGLKSASQTAMAGAGAGMGGTTIIQHYHGITLQNRLQAERDLRPIVKKIQGQ